MEAFAFGVLCIDPSVYYEMTPREMSAAIRGHKMQGEIEISRIRLAVWGDEDDIRKAMGREKRQMSAEDYAMLKSQFGVA